MQFSLTAGLLQHSEEAEVHALASGLSASVLRWQSENPELQEPLRALSALSEPAAVDRAKLAVALHVAGENLSAYSQGEAGEFFAEMRSYVSAILGERRAALPPAVALQTRAKPAKNAETILIVDDEVSMARIIKRQLEKIGYGALMAFSGAEAFKLASDWYAIESNPLLGIALVDIHLPDGRGEALVDRLRKLDPDLHAVFFSGAYAPDGLLERVPRSSFLPKPSAFDDIVAHLRRTMDSY